MNVIVRLTGTPVKERILCGCMTALLPCPGFDLASLPDTCPLLARTTRLSANPEPIW